MAEQRLSATALAEAYKDRSGEVWLQLLTFTHADLPDDARRFVNQRDGVTSNGEFYRGYPFQIVLPEVTDGKINPARLRIDNIDREVYDAIWALEPAPNVTIQVALASQPDVVEYATAALRLGRAEADAFFIDGDLLPPEMSIEPYPGGSFTPADFPGLF